MLDHLDMYVDPKIFSRFVEVSRFDGFPVIDKCKTCNVKHIWGVLEFSNGNEVWIGYCPECNHAIYAENNQEDFDTNIFSRRYKEYWFMMQWPIRESLNYTRDLDALDMLIEIYNSIKIEGRLNIEEGILYLKFENISERIKKVSDFDIFVNKLKNIASVYGFKLEYVKDSINKVQVNYGSTLHPEVYDETHHRAKFSLEKINAPLMQ